MNDPLPAAVRSWLDAPEHPAARYVLARDFGRWASDTARDAARPASPADLATAKAAVLAWEPLRAFLDRQQASGAFVGDGKRPDALLTVHVLALLARCGLDASDEPVARGIAWLRGRHLVNGVYSNNTGGSGVLPCYISQFLWLLRAVAHPEASALAAPNLAWYVAHQRFDDRSARAGGEAAWPFRAPVNYGCWQSVSCYHGVVGALLALASVPPAEREPAVRARLDDAVAWLRRRHVYRTAAGDRPLFRHMTQFFLQFLCSAQSGVRQLLLRPLLWS